jgi:lipopolysaccharide transport protein LptA
MSNSWTTAVIAVALVMQLRAQEAPDRPGLLRAPDDTKSVETAQMVKAESTAATGKSGARSKPEGPTEITSTKEASFNGKARTAVFVGDVRVKDPMFDLSAERLTVFLQNAADAEAQVNSNGLQKVIAEGNVEVTQTKVNPESGKPEVYKGKGERVEYDVASGNLTLRGWPQIQQGINAHVATEATTVMVLSRDGELNTSGKSRTLIQDTAQEPMPSEP